MSSQRLPHIAANAGVATARGDAQRPACAPRAGRRVKLTLAVFATRLVLALAVGATAGLALAASTSADQAVWDEDSGSDAQLSLRMREAFDTEKGLIKIEGRLPSAAREWDGSYALYVTTPPGRSNFCPRYPPYRVLEAHVERIIDHFAFVGSRTRDDRTGKAFSHSAVIRACGYLVRSQSKTQSRSPVVVARAQRVGVPELDPDFGDLLVGLVVIGAGVLFVVWCIKSLVKRSPSKNSPAGPASSPPSAPPKHTWPADDPPWRPKPVARSSPPSPPLAPRPAPLREPLPRPVAPRPAPSSARSQRSRERRETPAGLKAGDLCPMETSADGRPKKVFIDEADVVQFLSKKGYDGEPYRCPYYSGDHWHSRTPRWW